MMNWKKVNYVALGINESFYDLPELQWAKTSYIQPQMMIHERLFYDPETMSYTVSKYLSDLKSRYGGIDSVLLWQSYPNIGVDNRNQFEMIRDLPGYPDQVRDMIEQFHQQGVKVLLPYNPWDQGTEAENFSDDVTIANICKEVNADGFNGDTMDVISEPFFTSSLNINHPIALEPENQHLPTQNLNWEVLGWAYWEYPTQPCVSSLKYLIPRHNVNVCNRWATDHTNDLQYAFFNGVGFESWENIWGIWNQMVPRDAEALRRISAILRYFSVLFSTQYWEPHTPLLQGDNGAYASKFPSQDGSTILWTIVNRSPKNLTGPQINITHSSMYYYDVYNGVPLVPSTINGYDILSFFLEANGFGAVVAFTSPPSSDFFNFLKMMNQYSTHPLAWYSNQWVYLPQQMVPNPPTPPFPSAPGMIQIPSANFIFSVQGSEIEGGEWKGLDVQYPWESYPYRNHLSTVPINRFLIDEYPVTNRDFYSFLQATHYTPKDNHNFLKDWTNNQYPTGWEKKPVTWVSIEDARAYCSARIPEARLPNEWEWQYAAQGTDSRVYPWGNTWDPSKVPTPNKGRKATFPDDVDAHPEGASPFGVQDLVGNVYQWTNEFVDDHTRAAVIRGGNYINPQGSFWYEHQTYNLTLHTKYLLMAPSLDRSGGIGFRCVVDTPNSPPPTCTSNICGSMIAPLENIDLTKDGSLGWTHWGLTDPNSIITKVDGIKITASTIGGTPLQYSNNPNWYTWTDGYPVPQATNTSTGVFVSGKGNGFQITVPATTEFQTLHLYVGVWESKASITVQLSDGSAYWSDNSLQNALGTLNTEYIIQFRANTPGVLTVNYIQTDTEGNITLQSATLSK
uniref:Sulfatase-modifying factor enzyme-like domain-containing protein n=1 Tax=Arcella intermedia TaxID=1963864 RepID=A0A6B2KXM6_9EUKA